MAQLPNVKLKVHPSMFDLMMAVLERNAAAEDVPTRTNALDLMEKRMRFTRRYPGKDGEQYASIQMYESEAAEDKKARPPAESWRPHFISRE